jgi:hypothetical protein
MSICRVKKEEKPLPKLDAACVYKSMALASMPEGVGP